jgi:uncharacterized protein
MKQSRIKTKTFFRPPSALKWLGAYGLFLTQVATFAQTDCEKIGAQADRYLRGVGVPTDWPKAFEILKPCVAQGDPYAITLTACILSDDKSGDQNEDLAFAMVKKEAEKGYHEAANVLGNFYMKGTGCDIDYDQALHWLTIAADQGNTQAAFTIGYSYYKGFGVPQDYKKAMMWFSLSQAPMAKHFLGLCYYFGYGVPKDEDKAILNFSKSYTGNSEMMLKHIAQDVKKEVDTQITTTIAEPETATSTAIAKDALSDATDKVKSKPKKGEKEQKIDLKHLTGKWVGKMVELDWSGTQVVRVTPLQLALKNNKGKIEYAWQPNQGKVENTAVWENNSLYFDKLDLEFKEPYSNNPNADNTIRQIVSAKIKFKNVNKKTYLTANLNSYIYEYKEAGPPMHLILKRQGKEETKELTDDELLSLTSTTKEFITLYPNPFVNDVQIAYELKTPGEVSVAVYSYNGNATQVVLQPSALQAQGTHKYTLDGSKLPAGMYIVRVSVGAIVHTRIVIKQ